ncbi:hypothetical protein AAMO2058_001085300 [Amorphochlora amoebiformis]
MQVAEKYRVFVLFLGILVVQARTRSQVGGLRGSNTMETVRSIPIGDSKACAEEVKKYVKKCSVGSDKKDDDKGCWKSTLTLLEKCPQGGVPASRWPVQDYHLTSTT